MDGACWDKTGELKVGLRMPLCIHCAPDGLRKWMDERGEVEVEGAAERAGLDGPDRVEVVVGTP